MTHATLQLEAVSPIRLYVPTKVVVFIHDDPARLYLRGVIYDGFHV